MNNKKAKYIVIPFVTVIMAMFLIHIVSEDKESSASENRTLTQIPTVKDIKKEDFTSKFESYFSDQFPFREELSEIYSKLQLMLGKNKIKNYYVLENNWIMPTPAKRISDKELKDTANEINELSKIAINSNKKVYYASTPHKESMLSHLYPKYTDGLENATINKNKFKDYLDLDNINFIDIDEDFLIRFNENQREKLYFKTDHHWNGIGGFEGFKTIVKQMNEVKNVNWDDYKQINFDRGYFLGSYNMNLNKIIEEDETIPYVRLKNRGNYEYYKYDGKKETKGKEEDFVAIRRNEKEILYGGAYMLGNACNILKIRNEDSLTDKKILILRDSYQAPTSWLFADVFSEVQLVDPRYTDKLGLSMDDIIRDSDADIVMFMYNSTDFKSMIDVIKDQRNKL
ncbi:MAG: DHHW family protein [Terrisporobacter othiniensis]|uniref:DHHW family protein n=1 Tax=Terrisporobacter othiniensis TaxID=1577792 RepID=UPI0029126CAE|nr:DHHW family protein [Terrisporobacter othiniensis]MDU6986022.1 DHHW family protein [Terrisporobacter othiniensis]